MASGDQLIELAHPHTLDAAQLIDRTALRRCFAEAHREHLAHDLEPRVLIERETRLIQQAVGARTPGLPCRIESDARFAHPDNERAGT
jgi:hypothetical protein